MNRHRKRNLALPISFCRERSPQCTTFIDRQGTRALQTHDLITLFFLGRKQQTQRTDSHYHGDRHVYFCSRCLRYVHGAVAAAGGHVREESVRPDSSD